MNWLVARNIVTGWVLTLPAAAAVSAIVYGIIALFGGGAAGALVVSVPMLIAALLLWRTNRAQRVEPEETVSAHPTFDTMPVAA